MDRTSFDLEKEAVIWLTENGLNFREAVVYVSYAQTQGKSLCQAIVDLNSLKEQASDG